MDLLESKKLLEPFEYPIRDTSLLPEGLPKYVELHPQFEQLAQDILSVSTSRTNHSLRAMVVGLKGSGITTGLMKVAEQLRAEGTKVAVHSALGMIHRVRVDVEDLSLYQILYVLLHDVISIAYEVAETAELNFSRFPLEYQAIFEKVMSCSRYMISSAIKVIMKDVGVDYQRAIYYANCLAEAIFYATKHWPVIIIDGLEVAPSGYLRKYLMNDSFAEKESDWAAFNTLYHTLYFPVIFTAAPYDFISQALTEPDSPFTAYVLDTISSSKLPYKSMDMYSWDRTKSFQAIGRQFVDESAVPDEFLDMIARESATISQFLQILSRSVCRAVDRESLRRCPVAVQAIDVEMELYKRQEGAVSTLKEQMIKHNFNHGQTNFDELQYGSVYYPWHGQKSELYGDEANYLVSIKMFIPRSYGDSFYWLPSPLTQDAITEIRGYAIESDVDEV